MKFLSLPYLFAQAKKSFVRFPLTLIAALIAVLLGIYLIENGKNIDNTFSFINAMLSISLAIPLFFCVSIVASIKNFSRKTFWIANVVVIIIVVAVYFSLPNYESSNNISLPYVKYGFYNVISHLLVSLVPFLVSKDTNGFWIYNKILFLRFLLALLYSSFLYVGIILALTALNLLFDIKIYENLYAEIWIVTIGLFNTWFFVSGIPAQFDNLENDNSYPRGLRIFCQYVLLPLLGLYMLILYAYAFKIVVTSDWPKGVVSYLIICVSILGIFTFLLLYPYGKNKDHSWIAKISRIYYFVLFPLLILLYVAIFIRIDDYGITISRYAIVALAIWTSVVSIYFCIGKTNIKFVPISLAVILIMISFGPWGMFSVSEKSQVNRLKSILEQSKILINGKIQNETIWNKDSLPNLVSKNELQNENSLNNLQHKEVKSIIEYLNDNHGFADIKLWYSQDIVAITHALDKNHKKNKNYFTSQSALYMKSMGINEWRFYDDDHTYANYYLDRTNKAIHISDFDYLVNFDDNESPNPLTIEEFKISENQFVLSFLNNDRNSLILKCQDEKIKININELIKKLQATYGEATDNTVPLSLMTTHAIGSKYDIKLVLKNLQINSSKNKNNINNMSGYILIKLKSPKI